MLTLKRHLNLKGTYLFFSLFQTLPDFGFPRGILLRFLPSSVVLDAAMLFRVLTDARTWVSRFTIGPHVTSLFNMAAKTFQFGRIVLQPSVVFFHSKLSFAFVNRKPVLPGHVLVSPIRVVKRFCDLTEEEVMDLFVSTQKIARVIEKEYGATSLSIAIQDGPEAGQTVEHVHVHLLPRKKGDFESNDDVYKALDEHDKQQIESKGVEFRNEDDMSKEAASLACLFSTGL